MKPAWSRWASRRFWVRSTTTRSRAVPSRRIEPTTSWDCLETRQLLASELTAALTERADPDGNHVIIQAVASIEGRTTPFARVTVDVDGDGRAEQATRADREGGYRLNVSLRRGNHELTIRSRLAGERTTAATAALEVTRGDLVINWNATLLEAVRTVRANPPLTSRNLGMVHVAMYDAAAPTRAGWSSLVVTPTPPPPGSYSALAAANQAAYASAVAAFPTQAERFQAALSEGLGYLRAAGLSGRSLAAGRGFGQRVADAILAARADDGAKATVVYTPSGEPGRWRPTAPAFAPPLLPQWPAVKPIAVPDITAFRLAGPPDLTSETYASSVEEVRLLGSVNSTVRTADQTTIANFWADGAGTITPPGHWNQIAQDVANQQRSNPYQSIQMFAALNMALCDAAIAAWDSKYLDDLWRPITAIREADTDANPATSADPTWTPLLATPPFPSYVSGHSTFSGAGATVLSAFFGANTEFTVRSDPSVKLGTRSFASFQAAAEEAGMSRIYGGIHYSFDNLDGLALGRSIGRTVIDAYFRT